MIKEIIMKNIKGQVVNQPLSGRDIICGDNGMGKTTRAQAVGISLLGYVPGKGKLSTETYKLSSGKTMSVGLKTDKFEFTRSFVKKVILENDLKTPKVSQEISVSPSMGEKTLKQKEARIFNEVGNLPVMLDFNEFLDLSDAKRREFFYNLAAIDVEAWSKKGIYKKLLDKLLTTDLEENNPEMFTVLAREISTVMNRYVFDDIQQNVQNMLDYSKEQLTYWKAEKQKAENASQKISEYKNELQVTDRNLEKNKIELERLQNELISVSNIIAVYEEKQKAEFERAARIEALRREIQEISNATPPDNEENILGTIKSYESNIKQVNHSKEIEVERKAIAEYKADIEQGEKAIRQYNQQGVSAKSAVTAYKKLLDMIQQNKGHCVIDNRIKCEKKFDKFIDFSNEQIRESNGIMADVDAAIGSVEKIIVKSKCEIVKAENKINQFIDEERMANKNNEEIRAIISQLQNTLNTVKSFDSAKTEKIKIRQDELNRLNSPTTKSTADIKEELSKKVDIEAKIAELKAHIDEQNKTRIRLLDFKSSIIDGKEAACNEECWKLISKALGSSGIQGEIVKSILDPIKNTIQEKLDALGVQKDFFFETSTDNGKEVFQFGWSIDSEEKHNFDALSTGEQALLLIALITTIIERNNPPLKALMIDNVESLDKENFRKVIAGMNKVAQELDNVIFLGVIEIEPTDCPGWKIWNLNQEKKAAAV